MADENLLRVQRLSEFSEGLGMPVGRLALAWCLRRKEVSSVIVGATSVEQLEANVAASGVVLGEEVWKEADSILPGGL
jgi:L-glyceraldehyde 3-phosphate reductase